MNCPNCGEKYEEDIHICPVCATPLSNAIYTPVPSQQTSKHRVWFPLCLIFLLLAGLSGYYYYNQIYLKDAEKECFNKTNDLFQAASDLDLSEYDPALLPKEMYSAEMLEEMIETNIKQVIADSKLYSFLEEDSSFLDSSQICQDLTAHATYEIKKTSCSYDQCIQTVEVHSLDLEAFITSLSDEILMDLKTDQNLWDTISETVQNLFFPKHHHSNLTKERIEEIIEKHYQTCLAQVPERSYTGKIKYIRKNKSWQLSSIDPQLFYTYFGQ